jgi:putative salt-induced outer membrane protein YdiY
MPNLPSRILFTLLIALCAQAAFADHVILKNGDRISGKLLRKDGESVTIQTEAMGTVKIKWSAIDEVVSDAPVAVTVSDGKVVEGSVTADSRMILVKTKEGEELSFAASSVQAIRSKEEQSKFEAEQRRPADSGFFKRWSGTVDAGFSLTSGNSDTRTFTGGFKGTRETPKNKLSVYANALQVRNSSTGTLKITAQSVWWGARYDADINRKWFTFGSGDFEYNKPQKLDIRTVLGGGLGYHIVKAEGKALNVTVGATNNYENFSTGLTRNSAELLLGQDMRIRINNRARVSNRFNVYPNLSNRGTVRALFDASLQTDLNSWLGWHLTVGNRYNSRPVSATEKNDFLMSTGLRVSFGKNRKR